MNTKQRQPVLIALMLGLMLLAASWSTLRMMNQKRAAENAAQDLARCQVLADQIDTLRGQAALASEGDDRFAREQRLAEQISAASAKAGVTGPWLQGIEHKTAVRIEDTPYMRQPAVLLTRGLTMRQLTESIHHLTYNSAYIAEEIRLRTPPGESGGDRWDADITLTYLIDAPSPSSEQAR